MRKTLVGVSLVLSAACLLTPRRAAAGGFETARFGADHGQPALANPYAVYYNPAAMAGTTGTELTVDGTLALRIIDYTRDPSSLTPRNASSPSDPTYRGANSGPAHLANVVAAPFVGLVTDMGTRNLRLGLATYLPFGGQAQWDQIPQYANSRVPPAIDGPQRWSDIQGKIIALYNTLAISYRIEPLRLGIGAGMSLILHQVQDVRARNVDGTDEILAPDGSLIEGRALLDVSGVDLGASVGLYWEPLASRRLRVGASYTSQPGFGTMRLSGQLTQQFGQIVQQGQPGNVDLLQAYPDIVRVGAAWRLSDLFEARLDGTYERWSVFKNQCIVEPGATCSIDNNGADITPKMQIIQVIPRNWKDTYTVRGGGAFFINDTELFGSVGFGTGAPPKSTLDPSLFDTDAVFFTAGVRYPFLPRLYGAVSGNYVYYLPVDTTGKSQLQNYVPPSRSPNAGGSYDAQIYFINANVTYRF
jgi:long-chain fatty acid transport protein